MRAATLVLCAGVVLAAAGQRPARASARSAQSVPSRSDIPQRLGSQQDLSNGIIRGRVVRADTGEPIEGALVSTNIVAQSTALATTVASDRNGRFELRNLPAGTYQLTVSANGFAHTTTGARRPGGSGRAVTVPAGQMVPNVDFALQKAGVISGVVLDERGDPLPGAMVAVLKESFDTNGQRRLQQIGSPLPSAADGASDLTDDLGQFRVWGLAPGVYYLVAAQPSPDGVGSTTLGFDAWFTLFPGNEAEAQPLDVRAGQELSGVALTVRQVRMASIRGSVSGREGATSADLSLVRHTAVGDLLWGYQMQSTGGMFTIPAVPPGRYTVFVRKGEQIGEASVVVDEADVMVPMVLATGTAVRGRVVTESGEAPPNLQPSDVNVTATYATAPSISVRGRVNPDGTFELTGVPVPFRLRVSTATAQWSIESVSSGGTDVTGILLGATPANLRHVDVVVTQQRTTLTGIVRDGGKPSGDAMVLVFAEDEDRRWPGGPYSRTVRPEKDGAFSIRGLPPARYLAVAVDDLDDAETSNTDVLERLSRVATRFTLGHGSTQVLNLRVTKAR